MKIITDTSSLHTPDEGSKEGLIIVPACTIIGDSVYRDHIDIDAETFLRKIEEGAIPTSTQPSIGDVLEVYQECQDEMLVLPIGDGLSGTYQNMNSASRMLDEEKVIHVMDTKTLAGALWYLVQKAAKLRDQGLNIKTIKEKLQNCIETSASFVIAKDFSFLKRSGRLLPVAANLGTLLKIVPVLTQTEDKKKITLFAIKRTRKRAVEALIEHFRKLGVNEKYLITVSHGGVKEEAAAVLAQLKEAFVSSAFMLFSLPPTLICHGGPGCLVIQIIRM